MKDRFQRHNPGLAIKILVHSGDSIVIFPLLLMMYILASEPLRSVFFVMLAAMGGTALVVVVVKWTVRKARPSGEYGKQYRKYDPYSFPSGHAARAFCLACVMAAYSWVSAIILLVWALGISYTRIMLRLHFIPDVVAGMAIGSGTGILTFLIMT